MGIGSSYSKDFDEISDSTVLGMNPRDNSLKIWQTFGDVCELGFESRVVQEILHSVQSSQIAGQSSQCF